MAAETSIRVHIHHDVGDPKATSDQVYECQNYQRSCLPNCAQNVNVQPIYVLLLENKNSK